MGFSNQSSKYNSKNIALFSIFLAMILAIEFLPIPGLTDIVIPGTPFTIDPTGIPILLIFLFFGFTFSFVGVGIMGIAIGYRNFTGSIFKFFAELFKILGIAVAWWILRRKQVSYPVRIVIYTLFATSFCALGMYLMNGLILIPLFYGMEISAALTLSLTFVPLNVVQSVVNVVVGGVLFGIIPDDLRNQFAAVGDGGASSNQILELDDEDDSQN
ncbi:MAG: hypothetical protein ACW98Y_20465 [Candidatus Thorarchaeota archaeon]|jgi:riboflavin transporter FmnP